MGLTATSRCLANPCGIGVTKLEARGWVQLPARQRRRGPGFAPRLAVLPPSPPAILSASLAQLRPLQFQVFSAGQLPAARFNAYLARYHYLPYRSTVGENLAYLMADRQRCDWACALFSVAAWKAQPRDDFIGWTAAQRQAHLGRVANNSRFLILPWVHVPEFASHILGRVARRLGDDCQAHYGHRRRHGRGCTRLAPETRRQVRPSSFHAF
jgi:hypothetical protein